MFTFSKNFKKYLGVGLFVFVLGGVSTLANFELVESYNYNDNQNLEVGDNEFSDKDLKMFTQLTFDKEEDGVRVWARISGDLENLSSNSKLSDFDFKDAVFFIENDKIKIHVGTLNDYKVDNYFLDEENIIGYEKTIKLDEIIIKGLAGATNDDESELRKLLEIENKNARLRLMRAGELNTFALKLNKELVEGFVAEGEVVYNEDFVFRGQTTQDLNFANYILGFELVEEEFVGLDENKNFYTELNDIIPLKNLKVMGRLEGNADGLEYKANANYTLNKFISDVTYEFDKEKIATIKGEVEIKNKFFNDNLITKISVEKALDEESNYLLALENSLKVDRITFNTKVDTKLNEHTLFEAGIDYKVSDNLSVNGVAERLTDLETKKSANRLEAKTTFEF